MLVKVPVVQCVTIVKANRLQTVYKTVVVGGKDDKTPTTAKEIKDTVLNAVMSLARNLYGGDAKIRITVTGIIKGKDDIFFNPFSNRGVAEVIKAKYSYADLVILDGQEISKYATIEEDK